MSRSSKTSSTNFSAFFNDFAGDVLQGQAAQRQCHATAHACAVNIDKLK
jgi:hypothetical protein